jgi:glycosyltransferase involved in cell wall biosynthesis
MVYMNGSGHVDDVKPFYCKIGCCRFAILIGRDCQKCYLKPASCGRSIVATDVPGCRAIVEHGINGLLMSTKDANSLAGSDVEIG